MSRQDVRRRMTHAANIHRDVRLHAKAQATPPHLLLLAGGEKKACPPTIAGEGAVPRKTGLSSYVGFVIERQGVRRADGA
jgi:hypothetical protein